MKGINFSAFLDYKLGKDNLDMRFNGEKIYF